MARKLFFSFHYERDAWRAGQVRNSDLIPNEDEYGFFDSVDWETIQRQGDAAIERWINDQLKYTSVTVVLIGAETAERPWVQYEILESWNRGNGIVGVWIHNLKDQDQKTDTQGLNPFDQFRLPDGTKLSSICKTYDWALQDGRNNLGKWAEEAFQIRSKYGDKNVSALRTLDKTAGPVVIVRNPSEAGGFAPRSPWCPDDSVGRR